MLKQLRQKRVMKRVLWILALIIIPAFVLWGAGGLRESRNYAGMLFGKRVKFDEYRAGFDAVKNRALLTYGSKFYELQDKLNLEEAAWEHLIMLKEAKRKKIKVSNDEVITRIASFPFFQDKSGSFDHRAYALILNGTFRTEPREFEEEMRQFIMIEKLVQGVFSDLPEPTDSEIEAEIKKEEETKRELEREREEKKREEDKEKEEKIEKGGETKKEETPEKKRERIKNQLLMTKRIEAYQGWRTDLYNRAGLISNIKKEEEEVQEESKEGPEKEEDIKE